MTDWRQFWSVFPTRFPEGEFLRQVGRTFQGQCISEKQCQTLLEDVRQKLAVDQADRVLDLCCGNGLVSSFLARHCGSVTGVDFSGALIAIARKYHQPPNVRYVCQSVLELAAEHLPFPPPFTRICMYEALQHFREDQLAPLLDQVKSLTDEHVVFLLASIPDQDKLWDFYDTEDRRSDYLARLQRGDEGIGTWWRRSTIQRVAGAHQWRCEFLTQPDDLHTSHYRFDVRLTRSRPQ